MDWMGVLDKALGWAIPAICAGVVSWSVARVRAMNKERAADRERDADVRQGLQALLRDRIINAHSHYMNKGEYPVYARENVNAMYKSYHALGGNGTVTAIVRELEQLPTQEANHEGKVEKVDA